MWFLIAHCISGGRKKIKDKDVKKKAGASSEDESKAPRKKAKKGNKLLNLKLVGRSEI